MIDAGQAEPEHDRRDRPRDGLPRSGAQTRGVEQKRPGACRGSETDDGSDGPDEERLERGEAHDRAGRGAADAEQGLFVAAPIAARGRHDPRERGGDQHGRQAEEQEEHLRVDRVRPRAVELRGQVVSDDALAGERGLEVLRATEDLRERRSRIRRQVARQLGVHLDRRRPRRRVPEQRRPSRGREQDDVVGWSSRSRTGGRADPLEELIGGRQVDHTGHADRTGVCPARSIVTVDPVRAPRLAAVCCASSTPDRRAHERAYLPREGGRVPVRQTEDRAGTGRARGAAGVRREPRRRRVRHRGGDRDTRRRAPPSRAPAPLGCAGASWICQSTGTAPSASVVIDARLAVKNAPSDARHATATDTEAACAIMRPGRRRRRPVSQVRARIGPPPGGASRRASPIGCAGVRRSRRRGSPPRGRLGDAR